MVGSTLTLVANGCGTLVANGCWTLVLGTLAAVGVVRESVVWEELLDTAAMVWARTGHVDFGATKDDLGSWR